MLTIRHSAAERPNDRLERLSSETVERDPSAVWSGREGIVLIGGSGLTDFRVRVAQSHARSDLLPSFWSLAGILTADGSLWTVPLEPWLDASSVPASNGIQRRSIAEYDDPARYPNVAVLEFSKTVKPVLAAAERLMRQRAVIDLPDLMVAWLRFVWAAGNAANPLLAGIGLPSAAFVETVFGIAGVELTPGLASNASCPEAIWQSAKWWHDYYEDSESASDSDPVQGSGHADIVVPKGVYVVRQEAAAVTYAPGEPPRAATRDTKRTRP